MEASALVKYTAEVESNGKGVWMMARTYVDKEKAINALRRVCFLCKRFYNCTDCRIEESLVALKDLPAANVEEVKHGEWICLEAEIGYFACSECDHRILRAECNYCPNCGADMKRKRKDA